MAAPVPTTPVGAPQGGRRRRWPWGWLLAAGLALGPGALLAALDVLAGDADGRALEIPYGTLTAWLVGLAAAWGLAPRFRPTWLRTLALNLLLLATLVLAVEGVHYLLLQHRPAYPRPSKGGTITQTGCYYNLQTPYGYLPKPGRHTSTLAWEAAPGQPQPLYNVVYTIAPGGYRATPLPPPPVGDSNSTNKRQPVLAFGGSFMFGEGVADTATLPAQLAKACPTLAPLNYALHGHGPQLALHRLRRQDLHPALDTTPPVAALYLFIPDHLNRATGSSTIVTQWGADFPYYAPHPTQPDSVAYMGPMRSAHPLAGLYRALMATHTAQYHRLNLNPMGHQQQLAHTAAIFNAMQAELTRQYGACPLYLIYTPGADTAMNAHLHPAIRTVDASQLYAGDSANYARHHIPHDGHPNDRGHAHLLRQVLLPRLRADGLCSAGAARQGSTKAQAGP